MTDSSLYDKIGGHPTLERVHKMFYDIIFKHTWIGQFFNDKTQELLEAQQTDFMADIMGGPKNYQGRMPIHAHEHMFITDDVFELRHEILAQTLKKAGIAEDLAEQWLHLDKSFKRAIVKKSIDQCKKRFKTDEILTAVKPPSFKKTA